jgi:hypothetical protein
MLGGRTGPFVRRSEEVSQDLRVAILRMSKKICTPFVVYFDLCGNPKVDPLLALLVDRLTRTLNPIWVVNRMLFSMNSHLRNAHHDSKLVQDEIAPATARTLEIRRDIFNAHRRRQRLRRVRE